VNDALAIVIRRQLADHQRAANELRQILAEIESDNTTIEQPDEFEMRVRAQCRERGFAINANDEILEAYAAELAGYAPGTLRNWRYQLNGNLPFRKLGNRTVYKISDLAAFMREKNETESA
jgi:hypothetical protein